MPIQTQVDRRLLEVASDRQSLAMDRRRMDLRTPAIFRLKDRRRHINRLDNLRLVDQCLVDLRSQALDHRQEQALEDLRHRRRQDLELRDLVGQVRLEDQLNVG